MRRSSGPFTCLAVCLSVFDDTGTYWFASLPNHGVKLPAHGVKIRVLAVNGPDMRIRITS